tara:strand:- start:134 stop:349 length:216 start_codon:yes stop_codon:yes gene_type:complete
MKKDLNKSLIQFCNLQLSLLIKEESQLRQSVYNVQLQRQYLKEVLRELTGQEIKALPGEEEFDNLLRFPDK